MIILLFSGVGVHGQTIMNIYQNNGSVIQIPLSDIDSITYTILAPGNFATLTTLSVGNITNTSSTSGGNILNDGGTPVTQRGVCWSISSNPTTANNFTSDGSGTGTYTSSLTNLALNTTYYLRAYAINSAGVSYGNQISFTTTAVGSISTPGAGVTFDGYNYSSIIFGNGQEWMAENLRTSVYRNGSAIPGNVSDASWYTLASGAQADYDNVVANSAIYGKLYNWYAVADTAGLCPTGWHVPNDWDWNKMIKFLDPGADTSGYIVPSLVAGGMLKSTGTLQAGTGLWVSPNTDATNLSGFSGLPGGWRENDGSYILLGDSGYWWSSTQGSTSIAWYRVIGYLYGSVGLDYLNKRYGLSVRCIRD